MTTFALFKKLGLGSDEVPEPDNPSRYPWRPKMGQPIGLGRNYLVVESIAIAQTPAGRDAITATFRSAFSGARLTHAWGIGAPEPAGQYAAMRAREFFLAVIRGTMIKVGPDVDVLENAGAMHDIGADVLITAIDNACKRNDLAGARVQCQGYYNDPHRSMLKLDWYPEKHDLLERHLERLAMGWVGYAGGALLGEHARGSCERRADELVSHWAGADERMAIMWMRLAGEVERAQYSRPQGENVEPEAVSAR